MKSLRVYIWILRILIILISLLPIFLVVLFRWSYINMERVLLDNEIRNAALSAKVIKSGREGISTFYYYDAIFLVDKEGKVIKYIWNTGRYFEPKIDVLNYLNVEKIELLLDKSIILEDYGKDTLMVFYLNPEFYSLSQIRKMENLYRLFLFFSLFWILLGFVVSFTISLPYEKLVKDIKEGKTESLSFLKDILSREYVNALEQEREKRERFLHMARMILKNVPRGVAILDDRGKVILGNEIFEEVRKSEKINEAVKKMLKGFSREELEDNGRYFVVKAVPFQEKKLFYVEVEDITEEKRKEQMREREEKFLLISETISSFLHEIRNSLSSLKAFLSIVDLKSPELKNLFEPVREEIHNISESLLLYDEVIKTRKIKNFKKVNLREIVEVVIKEFKRKFKDKKYKIVNRVDEVEVEISPFLFKRALFNLLKNSYEAIEDEGTIEIFSTKADNIISLIVEDTGKGMEEGEIEKAVLPFYSTKEKGLGLGLPFVKKVMELHEGDIELMKKVPRGMRVILKFRKER